MHKFLSCTVLFNDDHEEHEGHEDALSVECSGS